MSKLSLAIATALMAISLAPAAQAYSTEPPYTVTQVAMIEAGLPEAGEICEQPMQPELVAALGLPKVVADSDQTELACAAK